MVDLVVEGKVCIGGAVVVVVEVRWNSRRASCLSRSCMSSMMDWADPMTGDEGECFEEMVDNEDTGSECV